MGVKISMDDIINQIVEEQQKLKDKKEHVKKLIETLASKLEDNHDKSYRKISQHLQGEIIKSLVSAHDLDIKISNTLLKSYEQLARLLREMETQSEVSGDEIAMILQALTGNIPEDSKTEINVKE